MFHTWRPQGPNGNVTFPPLLLFIPFIPTFISLCCLLNSSLCVWRPLSLLCLTGLVASPCCIKFKFKPIRQNTNKSIVNSCVVCVCHTLLLKYLGCWIFSSHIQTAPCWVWISGFMCLHFFPVVFVVSLKHSESVMTNAVDWIRIISLE